MRLMLSIASFMLAQVGFAAALDCATPNSSALNVVLSASVDSDYMMGAQLKSLNEVNVTAGENVEYAPQILADASYRPRTNQNRARFNLRGVEATTDVFDGIVHGILLPKILMAADIVHKTDTEIQFKAKVISSTDSYHDGIMEYFAFECKLTQN